MKSGKHQLEIKLGIDPRLFILLTVQSTTNKLQLEF